MALSDAWIEELLNYDATLAPKDFTSESGNVGRAAIDGALVVFDLDDPPAWLKPVLDMRDENGNTATEMLREEA